MTEPSVSRRQMSLDDVAYVVERHCGMSNEEAHALLEDILDEVGQLLHDKAVARARSRGPVVPLSRPPDIPDSLPYTEDWDPDFDPRKGLLLLRPDGTRPDGQDG